MRLTYAWGNLFGKVIRVLVDLRHGNSSIVSKYGAANQTFEDAATCGLSHVAEIDCFVDTTGACKGGVKGVRLVGCHD